MGVDYSCPKTHCKYNSYGECTYNDEDFIEDILINEDIDNCYVFSPKDGYCECGCELVEYHEHHPYGETFAIEYLYLCPKCG